MTAMKAHWPHAFTMTMAIMLCTWSIETPAAIVTSDCASINRFCTLDELVGGGSMRINDQVFANWSADDEYTVAPVDMSLVSVIPLDDQALNPGFQLVTNGAMRVTGFDYIDINLAFYVSVVSGASPIVGSSLELSALEFGAGNVGGIVAVSSDVITANGIDVLGEQDVLEIVSLPSLLSDSIDFASQTALLVQTNILITGENLPDTVALGSFMQRFRQTALPEPPLLPLLGLTLLLLWRRRHRSPL
ncbi:MAG: hypothetical protein AW10_02074 [Candidatus Accumulibacter appositus]|uniref:Uncharacterized protein n=2 Tax=Candidatus Accumulibacter TaxID=327159 RepID=A0A011QM53_9PROT|nr:MAG: hypothetical protein AW10_02074 [Candidatus Accumulibacter appositus]